LLLGLGVFGVFCVALMLVVLVKRRRAGGGVEQELRARLENEQAARVAAETRLESEQKNLAEQKRLLDEAEEKLKDVFAALSAKALKDSREQFLGDAQQQLKPIQDLLKDYHKRLGEVEKTRSEAYGSLKQHIEGLVEAHRLLQKETLKLSTALRSPTVRGRWGEITLRRVVEVAGMSRYCDFDEQSSTSTEGGRLRPDMIVRLPNERLIVVDSKVPLDSYMDATEAEDEAARNAALAGHASAVRAHMRALSQKSYWSQFDNTPDFVVLFLPGESFFSAALEQDRTLIEEGMKSGVIIATPTTLIALLKAVSHGWQQQNVAENARQIADAGRELYDRICTFADHFGKVGDGLRRAMRSYNQAVGSYESRLQPSARRLAELDAASSRELPDVPEVAETLRSLPAEAPGEEG
ncbi:MAG: DNA recombination protein RmuC, partial [Phycisphaerae bacterium]|nr:DNA recombination protein RmuC [Phycisphaerae bacterium]